MVFFCFFWLKPYFKVFSAKMQHLKKHKKKKDTICEHNCANCSCPNVLFSAFFIFAVFPISIFRDVFDRFPKTKNNKKPKQAKKKQQQKEDKRCKAKTNEIWWFKTKQDNKKTKEKNKNKITSWNKEAKKTTRKSKKQIQKWKTERKEARKEQERERERQRKRERQKREKVEQG